MNDDDDERAIEVGFAAIRHIDDSDAADVFASVTPERLATEMGLSASSVRYRLNSGRAWTFDRSVLVRVVVKAMFRALHERSQRSNDALLGRLAELSTPSEAWDVVVSAIAADISAFEPGRDGDASGGGGESVRLLLAAAAPSDPDLARALREQHAAWVEIYLPSYEFLFSSTDRVIKPDRTLRALAMHISGYLQGVGAIRRYAPTSISPEEAAETALAIMHAWTEPRDGRAEPGMREHLEVALARVAAARRAAPD